MENSYQSLIANLSSGVRREKLDGREFFVAPLSLIVPGILNGSRGPLLYTGEDAKKYAKAWEGSPVVVYHPTRNGKPISAQDSAVVHIGVVKNSKMGSKLQAEAWIDVENVKEHDERVYDALVNGTPMEVSTGLGTTIEDVPPGTTHNGQPYVGIAREWRADHLALLPDQRGACAISDGCGLMVNSNGSEIVDTLPQISTLQSWERITVANELKYKITRLPDPELQETVENCDDSGECEACKAKRLAKVANEEELVDNCKGEVECPKCKAKRMAKEKAAETTNADEPPADLVDNAEQVEYYDVSVILNCGGEGGTPGPCKLSQSGIRKVAKATGLSEQSVKDLQDLAAQPREPKERLGEALKAQKQRAKDRKAVLKKNTNEGLVKVELPQQDGGKLDSAKSTTVGGKKYKLGDSISHKGKKGTLVAVDPEGGQFVIKSENEHHWIANQLSHDDLRQLDVQNLLKRIENCKGTSKPGPCKTSGPDARKYGTDDSGKVHPDMKMSKKDHEAVKAHAAKSYPEHSTKATEATKKTLAIPKGKLNKAQLDSAANLHQEAADAHYRAAGSAPDKSQKAEHFKQWGFHTDQTIKFDKKYKQTHNDSITLSEDTPVEVKRILTYKNVQNLLKRIENCKGTGKPGPCPLNKKPPSASSRTSANALKASDAADTGSSHKLHGIAAAAHEYAAQVQKKEGNHSRAALHTQSAGYHRKKETSLLMNNSNDVLDSLVAKRSDINNGRPTMADKKLTDSDRLKLVDHLITNSSVWEEEDRETLNSLADVRLYGLAVQEQTLLENAEGDADPEDSGDDDDSDDGVENKGKLPAALQKAIDAKKGKKDPADEEDEEDEEMTENSVRPLTEAQWLAQAPKSIRSLVQNAQRREQNEKNELIINMTDHLDDEQRPQMMKVLNSKSLQELELLSTLKVTNATPAEDVQNYAGQAIPMRTMNSKAKIDPNDGLEVPVMNWKQESKVS
jgi:hypothetical protein